jgi:hypothetical protein
MNDLKNIWETIKTEKAIIITLTILLAFGIFCWLFWTPAKDFGLNFFTEISGATITVVILDRLIKTREDRKNIPQKLAAYEDVRLYVSRYISFWTQTFAECVPGPEPENLSLFFSEQGMSKILNYLYMDSEPNVTPPRKWWDWIPHNAKEFRDNGDKILDRHYGNLDPEAYGYVHQLTESSFNGVLLMIPSIKETDILYKFPRVKVLGSYTIKPQKEDYTAILGLISWCENSYLKLHRYNPTLKKIAAYTPNKEERLRPKSMIPEEIRQKEINELIEFRQRNK